MHVDLWKGLEILEDDKRYWSYLFGSSEPETKPIKKGAVMGVIPKKFDDMRKERLRKHLENQK